MKKHEHGLPLTGKIRQIVFGTTHGIISVLAIITGIARATDNETAVLITGIIALFSGAATVLIVEYLSAKSQTESLQLLTEHEQQEYITKPKHEINEMRKYYLNEGFTKKETETIIKRITQNPKRWIQAHATHILNFFPNKISHPSKDALQLMKFHLIGGTLPILPYVFLSVNRGMIYSIAISFIALFTLGAIKNPKQRIKDGLEIVIFASIAICLSYLLGSII